MTTTLLSSIAGSLLSLLFSYLPGLSDWYAQLGVNPDDGGTRKRLLMLALLCLTALASFGLACSDWGWGFGLALTCDRSGAVELVSALVFAIMANQSTYKISPQK